MFVCVLCRRKRSKFWEVLHRYYVHILLTVHSLDAIFNFRFYCREGEQNACFTLRHCDMFVTLYHLFLHEKIFHYICVYNLLFCFQLLRNRVPKLYKYMSISMHTLSELELRVPDSWIKNQFLDSLNQKFVKISPFPNCFSEIW